MSRTVFALALALAACVPDRDAGDPFAPVADDAPSAGSVWQPDPEAGSAPEPAEDEAPTPEEAGSGSGSDAAPAPAAPEDPAAAGLDPDLVLQAKALGVPLASLAPPAPPAPPPPSVDPAAAADEAAALLSGFGVRLVSTLAETQPPRAILGLPDGSERVVQSGDLLPDQKLVILAIGRDAVHVAKVIPDGDRARIEPSTLVPMYRGAAPATP